MQLRTEINLKPSSFNVGYTDQVLLLGSCFTQNIGQWLDDHFFQINLNPFGIQYNPLSIAKGLNKLMDEYIYTEDDLFFANGMYNCYDFHSNFSSENKEVTLNQMNASRVNGTRSLDESSIMMVTFGTAWVYESAENQEVVNNCHKLHPKSFNRYRLSVKEIVEVWSKIVALKIENNSNFKFIFTVSPIRHIKDTLHGNQLSKSTLLLAIDQLQDLFPENVFYFPAYEIVLDDLRDYRFYAEDMTHPSLLAVKYIQEVFASHYFNKETTEIYSQMLKFRQALNHRPKTPNSEEYKSFLTQNIHKLESIQNKYPYFRIDKITQVFKDKIKGQ